MTLKTDYQAILQGAAVADVMPRGMISVSGADRAGYLQGLLTNDIEALQPGTGCYSAWLTPQGRMMTDMHVIEGGDMLLLDVPAHVTTSVQRRLEDLIFTEDVQVADLTADLSRVCIHGPEAAKFVEKAIPNVTGLDDWIQYCNTRSTFKDASVVVVRVDQLGVPGFVIYTPNDSNEQLRDTLLASGALLVGTEAIAATRIEAGIPLFGIDMDEEIIPLEAGIESRAISFTKGCYVGQEVVIRILDRGHGRIAKKLVGLCLDSSTLPKPGTILRVADHDVGTVTSVAYTPRSGAIALGYVHRDYVEPGSRIEVTGYEKPISATVSALPFP
jgi:folate-binding protein YgfZ